MEVKHYAFTLYKIFLLRSNVGLYQVINRYLQIFVFHTDVSYKMKLKPNYSYILKLFLYTE